MSRPVESLRSIAPTAMRVGDRDFQVSSTSSAIAGSFNSLLLTCYGRGLLHEGGEAARHGKKVRCGAENGNDFRAASAALAAAANDGPEGCSAVHRTASLPDICRSCTACRYAACALRDLLPNPLPPTLSGQRQLG